MSTSELLLMVTALFVVSLHTVSPECRAVFEKKLKYLFYPYSTVCLYMVQRKLVSLQKGNIMSTRLDYLSSLLLFWECKSFVGVTIHPFRCLYIIVYYDAYGCYLNI